MRPGETRKACPGCKEDCRYKPRPVDGVCSECRKLLDRERENEQLKALKKEGLKPYYFPERGYALPYIRHDKFEHPLQDAFYALAKEIAVPDPDEGRKHHWYSDGVPELVEYLQRDSRSWGGTAMFRPRVAARFRTLFNAIRDSLEFAYSEGRDDGSNLLRRLASGDVSVVEFDERTGADK